MDKKIIFNSVFIGLILFIFIFIPVLGVNAAEEIDAYCVVPKEAVPHGSTVSLTIKFSDSDKSNEFIVQGPFTILRYENGKAIIVNFKRSNDKDDKGKENSEKPVLTFDVTLSPKHKLPAPATELVTFTYFVKHKEGKRGELFTTNREQQVDCSFTVQHEMEKLITPSDLGIKNIGTLPTSPWYFLKEWGRGVSRFFTFNSVAKAELELKITNEKAAEILKIEENNPDNSEAIKKAIENYTKAQERLKEKFNRLKKTSENPNVEKLLEKLNKHTLKHAILFNQLAEKWSVINSQGARDNHFQGAVDIVQKKIQEIIITTVQKDKNIEQKEDGSKNVEPQPAMPVSEVKPVPTTPAPKQMVCTQEYNPVCGVDGKTYSNSCFAKISGVVVNYVGECRVINTPEKIQEITPPATGTYQPNNSY